MQQYAAWQLERTRRLHVALFAVPLLEAASLYLFADEKQNWHCEQRVVIIILVALLLRSVANATSRTGCVLLACAFVVGPIYRGDAIDVGSPAHDLRALMLLVINVITSGALAAMLLRADSLLGASALLAVIVCRVPSDVETIHRIFEAAHPMQQAPCPSAEYHESAATIDASAAATESLIPSALQAGESAIVSAYAVALILSLVVFAVMAQQSQEVHALRAAAASASNGKRATLKGESVGARSAKGDVKHALAVLEAALMKLPGPHVGSALPALRRLVETANRSGASGDDEGGGAGGDGEKSGDEAGDERSDDEEDGDEDAEGEGEEGEGEGGLAPSLGSYSPYKLTFDAEHSSSDSITSPLRARARPGLRIQLTTEEQQEERGKEERGEEANVEEAQEREGEEHDSPATLLRTPVKGTRARAGSLTRLSRAARRGSSSRATPTTPGDGTPASPPTPETPDGGTPGTPWRDAPSEPGTPNETISPTSYLTSSPTKDPIVRLVGSHVTHTVHRRRMHPTQ